MSKVKFWAESHSHRRPQGRASVTIPSLGLRKLKGH